VPIPELGGDIAREMSPGSPESRTLPRLINVGIGFGAFVLSCIVLHGLLPFPQDIDQVSQKLRFFRAHKNDYDTLFIGSSRIYHQVSPAVFDGEMRETGTPTRSFNFGVDGMHLPESAYVLEQVLKTKPRNLKWIFVEFDELQANWLFQGEGSRRALYWHDSKRTSLLLRKLTGSGTRWVWLPNLKKLRDIILCRKAEVTTHTLLSFHAGQFQKNFTNVARARDVIDYFASSSVNAPDPKYLGAAGDGYIPITKRMSAAQTAAYERALSRLMAQNTPRSLSAYTLESCRQCAEQIRAIGAIPIFVVTPTMTKVQIVYRAGAKPPGIVMAFNDPHAYPNLYRSDVRMDQGHMVGPAAEEFTRVVATDFAQLLEAGAIK
jgi:hypothetical protein